MSVRDTSREAFQTVDVPAAQAAVFDCIHRLGPSTDLEIARWLAWPINRVTPRRGELVEAGRVEQFDIIKGPTGRKMHRWRVVANPKPAAPPADIDRPMPARLIAPPNPHDYAPVLPEACAGCGHPFSEAERQNTFWRPLGDGAVVHYSGGYGLKCVDAHQRKTRGIAAKPGPVMGSQRPLSKKGANHYAKAGR